MYDDNNSVNSLQTEQPKQQEQAEPSNEHRESPNVEYRGEYSYSNVYPNDFYKENPKKPKKEKKEKKGNGLFGKIAVCLLLGTVFGGFAGISFVAVKGIDNYLNQEPIKAVGNLIGEAAQTEKTEQNIGLNTNHNITAVVTDVTEVVKEVMPSVVSITNKSEITENYFGRDYTQEGESSGSGIIVGENEKELLLVTNYHVVANSKELSVQFIDGETAMAQVKGTDSTMDLAVIAISLEELKESTKDTIAIAKLGDSDSLKVGEPAIAIGNALGYGQSVTTGVISALNREVEMQSLDNAYETTKNILIQTDAAINPGNSGGALLNVNGEVIGINSNKIGGSVIEGMGYAIPISKAMPIMEQLMVRETRMLVAESQRGYLGISGVNVTSEVSEIYGLPQGIYIAQVYEGTGAEKAGLVKGDIITKFDGVPVNSMEKLTKQLAYYGVGDTATLTIKQGSPTGYQEKEVTITLGEKFD